MYERRRRRFALIKLGRPSFNLPSPRCDEHFKEEEEEEEENHCDDWLRQSEISLKIHFSLSVQHPGSERGLPHPHQG